MSATPRRAGDVRAAERPRRGSPRRTELAAFLRSRRARITPQDVGMPPGLRRRTPGLRREEVAQLAGVGVTWYTWLEQGRPINASVQVLDAVARTLRLDSTERKHLYHLAGVPAVVEAVLEQDGVGAQVQGILDALDPLPAVVYNARYDVLADNEAHAALFPSLRSLDQEDRNALLWMFTGPSCCANFVNKADEVPSLVALLRGSYGRHIGEPAWESLVSRLLHESAQFAQLWANGDVAQPGGRVKMIQHVSVGEIRLTTASLSIDGMPEHRIVAFTPTDDDSRELLARLRRMQDPAPGCAVRGGRQRMHDSATGGHTMGTNG